MALERVFQQAWMRNRWPSVPGKSPNETNPVRDPRFPGISYGNNSMIESGFNRIIQDPGIPAAPVPLQLQAMRPQAPNLDRRLASIQVDPMRYTNPTSSLARGQRPMATASRGQRLNY